MSDLPEGANAISKWCHDAFHIKVAPRILDMNNVLVQYFYPHMLANQSSNAISLDRTIGWSSTKKRIRLGRTCIFLLNGHLNLLL